MDNAEEVMQLLEEFSKMKPKDIPRELEEYLMYVAKTGDTVYQWSLVKCLFREKLINVITDFFESTPTIELPPCPNVDPFNYERMKTSLLERLESFSSAPFTVQRICELLTNPRKEYNRVDKYMRAIEKNILVVSTREPGTGKRQDGENNSNDAVLNGIADSRGDVEDGINSPLLGTPPASNEVIVSTCSEQDEIEISDSSLVITENDKAWIKPSENIPVPSLQDSPLVFKTISDEVETKELCVQEDSTSSLDAVIEENNELVLETNNEDSLRENVEIPIKEENIGTQQQVLADKNEVISTPDNSTVDNSSVITLLPEIENPEITSNISFSTEDINTDIPAQVVSNSENPETKDSDSSTEISINSTNTTEEIGLDKEIETKHNVVVESPDGSPQNVQEVENPIEKDSVQTVSNDTDPDSSSELVEDVKELPSEENELCPSELQKESEADLIPESSQSEMVSVLEAEEKEYLPDSPKLEAVIDIIPQITLPPESTSEEAPKAQDVQNVSSDTGVNNVPDIVPSVNMPNQETIHNIDTLKENPDDIIENSNEICDQERREGSIIHTTPNLTPEIESVLAMEEVSVDQLSCGIEEEEAMDVDESSNQQMVMSEGENEGEPMDQSDQPQS